METHYDLFEQAKDRKKSTFKKRLGISAVAIGSVLSYSGLAYAVTAHDAQASREAQKFNQANDSRVAKLVKPDGFNISFDSMDFATGIWANDGVDVSGIKTNSYATFDVNLNGCQLFDVSVGVVTNSEKKVVSIDPFYQVTNYGNGQYGNSLNTYHFDNMAQLRSTLLGNSACQTIAKDHLQTVDYWTEHFSGPSGL